MSLALPSCRRKKNGVQCDVHNDRTRSPIKPIGKVATSLEYIGQHLNQRPSVTALAAQVGYSLAHFYKQFSQQVGSGPIAYWNQLRVEEACILLATTTMSMKEISAQLGYKDPLYFSRCFKLSTGTAPSQYRRLNHPSHWGGKHHQF